MSEFAKYLFNNRIRFNSIFPSIKLDKIVNNQTISSETLKLGFQNASFPLSEEEFSVIMTHFDPINKSKVLVEELKHEISKYEPKYFTQNYQRINPEEIDNKLEQKSKEFENSPNFGKIKYNANLLNGMNKIKNHLERNNIPTTNFFIGLFDKKKNLDDKIDEAAWKNAFSEDKKKYVDIPDLKSDEINVIFREVDSKLKNEVPLGDIINFFNDYLKKNEKLIDINDETSLNEYIKGELSNLFDNYKDKERDLISFENFYICLKSINHKSTKEDANKIISDHIKSNKVEMIEKKVFEEIMFNQIQKELVIQKEEKNYIINLFKQADFDKNGYLKRNQIKYLIKNKIGCNLTDAELDEILDKVDIKQENEIDIIEFVYLLDNINSTQNNKLIESDMNQNQNKELIPIMNLNLNLNMHRKIRPKDFMSLYSDLPISFIPSFIREEQQKNNLLS
jgi:Ca2+-binding EF-hand superfamily protein